jgi:hypothetical protein
MKKINKTIKNLKKEDSVVNLTRSPYFMGMSPVVELHYNDSCTLDPAISTPAVFVFKANDCYDPNYTSTGHQPLGYDNLGALYSRYCVLESWIKVTFCPKSTTDTVQNLGGICLSSSNTLGTSLYEILEQPLNKYTAFRNSSTYGGPRSVDHHVLVSAFTGIKDPNSSPSLSALTSASPTDPIYWVVWASAEDETNTAAIDVQVRIVYRVKWTRPRYLSSS